MPDEDWIKTFEDGTKVKLIYQQLPEEGAFVTAQLAGNGIVYSLALTKAKNPQSRDEVESRFKGELSKKYYHSFWNTGRGAADSNCATTSFPSVRFPVESVERKRKGVSGTNDPSRGRREETPHVCISRRKSSTA